METPQLFHGGEKITEYIKLVGAPGTGKTTTAMAKITELLNTYDITDICFTTYTTAGIKAIKNKIEDSGIILPKTHYIKTLNALTWHLAGYSNDQILKQSDITRFFKEHKIPTRSQNKFEPALAQVIIDVYNTLLATYCTTLSHITDDQIKQKFSRTLQKYCIPCHIPHLTKIMRAYDAWKIKHNKKDYIDSIITCITDNITIPCKVLFVDEAQDLNRAQHHLVRYWVEHSNLDIFLLAGDDDQAVHAWNGADPNFLIDYKNDESNHIILDKSYRLPHNIAHFCNTVSQTIRTRIPKTIQGQPRQGGLYYLDYNIARLLQLINEQPELFTTSTYFLCRTNAIKHKLANILFDRTNLRFGFLGNGQGWSKWTAKFMRLSNALNKLDQNIPMTGMECGVLISLLPVRTCIAFGNKKKSLELTKRSDVTYDDIAQLLIPERKREWDEAKANKTLKQTILPWIFYAGQAVRSDIIEENKQRRKKLETITELYDIDATPPVQLGTFHGSKGLEADNVFVLTGTNHHFRNINDSEKRCFYTACSRAKYNLYIVAPHMFSDQTYLYSVYHHIIYQHATRSFNPNDIKIETIK